MNKIRKIKIKKTIETIMKKIRETKMKKKQKNRRKNKNENKKLIWNKYLLKIQIRKNH